MVVAVAGGWVEATAAAAAGEVAAEVGAAWNSSHNNFSNK